MKTCSYCGAEYPDDAVMCATDHTPLAGAPILPLQEFTKDWSWIRGAVRLFSFLLVVFALIFTWFMLFGRIDTPEEFVSALWSERLNAAPVPFAVFLLILTSRRPRVWMRGALAVLAGFVLWFFIWRWLIHCDYASWPRHGLHVVQVDDNHLVYEMGGFTNRENFGIGTFRGIPMLFASVFIFAGVSALLVQLLVLVGDRHQTNHIPVHVKPIS
jgi:hypothetical protein